MNRSFIVRRAVCALAGILGFALIYGLPMLGLSLAVEHGLYVTSAATVVPFLRLDGAERARILEYYRGTDGAQLALVEIGGDTEYGDDLGPLRLAVTVDRLDIRPRIPLADS
ncbi:hypothetical protein I0Q12_19590 [Rhodococcus sp. CX]|uniref:hypothetical protein n=1 Tax=Rhodococcus sp. CX TaxID=2789880 RepID=UPI0018CF7666|nr:hypothetical protein [Rhodococcus sp. CX]MBH0121595.1 hypothetical protein [Rhodococcus sp. CX]